MNVIIRKDKAKAYRWGIDCHSYLMHESVGISVKLETIPVKRSEKLHIHHHITQIFYILKGSANLVIDSKSFMLKPHECIAIFPGQQHSIRNTGEKELEFLLISQPPVHDDRKDLVDL